jgi:hypothetical protein
MNATGKSSSGDTAKVVTRFVVGVAAAMLLYVLSIGPAASLASHLGSVKMFASVYRPVVWTASKLNMGGPLTRYINWWLWEPDEE